MRVAESMRLLRCGCGMSGVIPTRQENGSNKAQRRSENRRVECAKLIGTSSTHSGRKRGQGMGNSQACSESQSDIIRLFLKRSGMASPQDSPEQVMSELVERTARGKRGKRVRGHGERVQCFLDARNIVSVEFVRDAAYDGMIEPVGSAFSDGFR